MADPPDARPRTPRLASSVLAALVLCLLLASAGGVAAARSAAGPDVAEVGSRGPAWMHAPAADRELPAPATPAAATPAPPATTPGPAPALAPAPAPGPAPGAVVPSPVPASVAPPTVHPVGRPERVISAYVTGYTWFDNTPAGSARVSNPVLHSVAGGRGTWQDPITVAVGHSLASGADVLRWPAGTRFYLPSLRRYLIVEDTCGDGPDPQDEACSTGYPVTDSTWLDVWIDGHSGSRADSAACADAITGSRRVIVDPRPDHPVSPGAIAAAGACAP